MPVVTTQRRPEGHTPKKLVVRVLLANVHAGAMRAISYAQSLGVDDVRAVSFAFDGEDAERFRGEWQRAGLDAAARPERRARTVTSARRSGPTSAS